MKEVRVRTRTAILSICILLALAVAPWIASCGQWGPLMPDALRQGRKNYEATRAAAEAAAIEDMRNAPSTVTVHVIGMGGTITPTSTRIVVRSGTDSVTSPETPTLTLATPTAESKTDKVLPPTPRGLVDAEDVITEAMLNEQVKRDVADDSLSDLIIRITPKGVQAVASAAILPGVKQRIEASGTFAVENSSLVIKVTNILLDDLEVTERYHGQLENSLNSSLYRLLPQRYVQSYELGNGEVRVSSKVRP